MTSLTQSPEYENCAKNCKNYRYVKNLKITTPKNQSDQNLSDNGKKLKIERLSSLLFVKIIGQPLTKFKPLSYVKSWIKSGRSADDLAQRKRTKECHDDYAYLTEY